jgi:hypothetical protein
MWGYVSKFAVAILTKRLQIVWMWEDMLIDKIYQSLPGFTGYPVLVVAF